MTSLKILEKLRKWLQLSDGEQKNIQQISSHLHLLGVGNNTERLKPLATLFSTNSVLVFVKQVLPGDG